jgi:PIN domain nuclease of toxin-antitoxin system
MSSPSGPLHLLLDTHYWLWLQAGVKDHISDKVLKAIEAAAASGHLLLSIISVWELGMLEAKGRIRLQRPCEEWVKEVWRCRAWNSCL